MRKKQVVCVLVVVFVIVPLAFVADQARRTLDTLAIVERERDTWQRPEEILRQLNPRAGDRVVDLGSGAGYFALKIAPRVGPEGRVVAVDLRRQSLAFLWIRAVLGGDRNLRIVRGRVDDPQLPSGPFDAVLIANTYHELTEPASILGALFKSMRPGARMVVVDRGPPDSAEPPSATAEHHVSAAFAEGQIHQQGFQTVSRDDHFIDRPGNDNLWWLIVFRRP